MRSTSRHKQRGFLPFLLPAIATIGAAAIAKDSQGEANQANIDNSREAREFNAVEASKTRDFNSAQAAASRDWSSNMSNTSYQRAVADMRAAGLNPMLAYSQGGASTPSAASASGGQATAPTPPDIKPTAIAGLNAAFQAAQYNNLTKTGENIDADTALKEAQTTKETSSALNLDAQTTKTHQEVVKVQAEVNNLRQELQRIFEDTKLKSSQINTEVSKQSLNLSTEQLQRSQATLNQVTTNLRVMETDLAAGRITQVQAETALTNVKTVLNKLEVPLATNEANAQSTWFKEKVSPFLPDLLKSTTILKKGQ